MPTALGEKIRRLRKQKGFTLDKLAELSGCSKSYVWELENKQPPRPSAEKLSSVADSLDTTLEYLLDDEDALTEEDAADARFYRRYRKMNRETKEKIRQTVRLWGDDE